MSDYEPKLITEMDVRNFFSPPLSYTDVSKAEILLKIEAVEDYISAKWGITSSSDGKIPALLLVASKIVQNPNLAKKYYTLRSESIGKDYSYSLALPTSKGAIQTSPYALSKTWEEMAIEMLNSRCTDRWKIRVVNG